MTEVDILQQRVSQVLGTQVRRFEGGFTGSSKFVADDAFLKVADNLTHPLDAKLISYEAGVYEILQRLGLTNNLFPGLRGLIQRDELTILSLDYLGDVSWGGPWNDHTVRGLDNTLNRLHTQTFDGQIRQEITNISESVLRELGQEPRPPQSEKEKTDRNKPFLNTWNPDRQGFMTAGGNVYFQGSGDLPQVILAEAEKVKPHLPTQLILHDMNLTNIGVSKTQIYLVDPLFARFGDPNWDRTVAGVSILSQIGADIDSSLGKQIEDSFLMNRHMLARLIKYYVTVSATPSDQADPKWLEFHQRCAATSLSVFTRPLVK